MARFGVLSATHLYFLAAAGAEEAAWLARLTVGSGSDQLHRVELELLAGSWPFSRQRTRQWFEEQFAMSAASIERFGLPAAGVAALQDELPRTLADWCVRNGDRFGAEPTRASAREDVDRAAATVPARTTLGSPKAWGSIDMTPEEEVEYREVLFANNLDLLFHRIVYWANGKRSVLDIIERLEIELKELLGDTSISRTASGFHISGGASLELDVGAVLFIVDKIVSGGYLR